MNVDQLLGTASLLIIVLLVLAAAIESVLETLRGVAGQLLPSLKGAQSLDDALELAREFSAQGGAVEAQPMAIRAAAERIRYSIKQNLDGLDDIAAQLAGAQASSLTQRMNEAANEVSAAIGEYERRRILILRVVSAVIGVGLAFISGVDLLDLISSAPGFGRLQMASGFPSWIGEVVTGIAASSGSSFWHDQLDRVRSVKNVHQQLAALVR
jgi:hypothetical protein